jgi:hypothetical protein
VATHHSPGCVSILKADMILKQEIAAPHMCTSDDEYNGYFIPKGTVILGNVWLVLMAMFLTVAPAHGTVLTGPSYTIRRCIRRLKSSNQSAS